MQGIRLLEHVPIESESHSIMSNSLGPHGSPPGSSVHGILQARILEWVAIPFFRDFPDPEIKPGFSVLAGGFFITELPRKPSQMEHNVTDFSLSETNTSKC